MVGTMAGRRRKLGGSGRKTPTAGWTSSSSNSTPFLHLFLHFCILHFCISKLKSGRKTPTGGWTLSSSNSTPFLYFSVKSCRKTPMAACWTSSLSNSMFCSTPFHLFLHFMFFSVHFCISKLKKCQEDTQGLLDLVLDSMPFHLLGHICLFGKA